MRAFLLAAIVASTPVFAAAEAPPADNAASTGNTMVTFKNPGRFVDARTDGFAAGASADVMAMVKTQVEKLGQQYIPAGQHLEVTITDIDLAGRYDMVHSQPTWVRVMRDSDWPRIDLHYKLTQDGRTLGEGDASISDLNYMSDVRLQRSTDSFRYEKKLLAQWFAKTFSSKAS